jgi:uncharacterized phage-associated protein
VSVKKGHDARLEQLTASLDKETIEHIDNVIERYGYKSHDALVLMTHRETPWLTARKGLADFDSCAKPITHKSMKSYFSKVLEEAKARSTSRA